MAQSKGVSSYNIHPYTPMAEDGYPRDRCEAEFGVGRFAGAMATKTIDFLLAFLRKLRRACKLSQAACVNYRTDPVCTSVYGIKTILSFAFGHNLARIHFNAKFGFTKWGHLPSVAELDGIERELVIMRKRLERQEPNKNTGANPGSD